MIPLLVRVNLDVISIKKYLHSPNIWDWSLTIWCSLVSYPEQSLVISLLLCSDTVSVFYRPIRQGSLNTDTHTHTCVYVCVYIYVSIKQRSRCVHLRIPKSYVDLVSFSLFLPLSLSLSLSLSLATSIQSWKCLELSKTKRSKKEALS